MADRAGEEEDLEQEITRLERESNILTTSLNNCDPLDNYDEYRSLTAAKEEKQRILRRLRNRMRMRQQRQRTALTMNAANVSDNDNHGANGNNQAGTETIQAAGAIVPQVRGGGSGFQLANPTGGRIQPVSHAEQFQMIAAAAASHGVGINLTLHNDYGTHTQIHGNLYQGNHNDSNAAGSNGSSSNGVDLLKQLREMENKIIQEVRTVPDTIARHQGISGEQKHVRREQEANRTNIPGMQDVREKLFSPTRPNAPVESPSAASGDEFFDAKTEASPAGKTDDTNATKTENASTVPKVETVLSDDDNSPAGEKTGVPTKTGPCSFSFGDDSGTGQYKYDFRALSTDTERSGETEKHKTGVDAVVGAHNFGLGDESGAVQCKYNFRAPPSDTERPGKTENHKAGVTAATRAHNFGFGKESGAGQYKYSGALPSDTEPSVPTALSRSDTKPTAKPSASVKTAILYFDPKCFVGSKLVTESKGDLVIGEYNSVEKILNVQLICPEGTISIPIPINQWSPPEIEDNPHCQVWLDVVSKVVPRKLFRGQRAVLEELLKAVNEHHEFRRDPDRPFQPRPPLQEIQPVAPCFQLCKHEGAWKHIVKGPMEYCDDDGSEESMKINIASKNKYSISMKYHKVEDLRVNHGKAAVTFDGLVFQDEQEIFAGIVSLAVKERESQALEVLVEKFRQGRTEWLSTQRKAPPLVVEESKDEVKDSEELAVKKNPEEPATREVAGGDTEPKAPAIEEGSLAAHPEEEQPAIEEGGVAAQSEAPGVIRIKVNEEYGDVKFQGAIGYIVGRTDSRTFKIVFEKDELNEEAGGKGMRKSSFTVV